MAWFAVLLGLVIGGAVVFAAAESILSSGVRSLVAAPLLDAEGALGMIVAVGDAIGLPYEGIRRGRVAALLGKKLEMYTEKESSPGVRSRSARFCVFQLRGCGPASCLCPRP